MCSLDKSMVRYDEYHKGLKEVNKPKIIPENPDCTLD